MSWRRAVLFFLILVLGPGCAGGPGSDSGIGNIDAGIFDGNPATRPTPGFTEVELKPATSTALPAPSKFLLGLPIEDGLAEIDEVRFFVQDLSLLNQAQSPVFNLPGPFVVRLIESGQIVDQALPDFGGAVVPNGSYSRLNLKFLNLTQDNIPAEAESDPIVTGPMLGHSMLVQGSIVGPDIPPINGQLISFIFLSHQTSTVQIQTPDALEFSGEFITLFTAFKIQTWLDSLLIAVLELDPLILLNGTLVLDTQSNIPLLRDIALQIESNINHSLRFAPSADGIFDEGEVQENSSSQVVIP